MAAIVIVLVIEGARERESVEAKVTPALVGAMMNRRKMGAFWAPF